MHLDFIKRLQHTSTGRLSVPTNRDLGPVLAGVGGYRKGMKYNSAPRTNTIAQRAPRINSL